MINGIAQINCVIQETVVLRQSTESRTRAKCNFSCEELLIYDCCAKADPTAQPEHCLEHTSHRVKTLVSLSICLFRSVFTAFKLTRV